MRAMTLWERQAARVAVNHRHTPGTPVAYETVHGWPETEQSAHVVLDYGGAWIDLQPDAGGPVQSIPRGQVRRVA